MPHVTEHTPKVSTRSVKPYACESSRESDSKTDRHTDGLSKTTFLDVLRVVPQIRSYLEVDFLHDANTSIDMEGPTIGTISSGILLPCQWKYWHLLASVCLSVCPSVRLSVGPSVCRTVCLAVAFSRALTGVRVNRSSWNFRGMFSYMGHCAVLIFEAIRQPVHKII